MCPKINNSEVTTKVTNSSEAGPFTTSFANLEAEANNTDNNAEPAASNYKLTLRPATQCTQAFETVKHLAEVNSSYYSVLQPFIGQYLKEDASEIGFNLGEHRKNKAGNMVNGFSNFPRAIPRLHNWVPSSETCNIVALNYSTRFDKQEIVRGVTKAVPYMRVYAVIFDFDNHNNIDSKVFFDKVEELYQRVPENFRPNIVSKSHGSNGVHWHFFLENPVEIKVASIGQLKYFLIQNVFSNPLHYSPFFIDMQGTAGINPVNRESLERLNADGDKAYRLDVLFQVNEFVSPLAYKSATGKNKAIKCVDDTKTRQQKIVVPANQFKDTAEAKKVKQPSLDNYAVTMPFEELEALIQSLDLQLENNYKNPKIVLRTLADELRTTLSDKVKSAILKIKSPIFINEYVHDEHNGYLKVLVNDKKTIVKLIVYSNAAQSEILTLVAKTAVSGASRKKIEKTTQEVVKEYLEENNIEIKSDGNNVFCSHSFVVLSDVRLLDKPSVLSANELNNLMLIIKQVAKDREYFVPTSLADITSALAGIGSSNAYCPEVEKFEEYGENYREMLKDNPQYDPAAEIAKFWPDVNSRKIVEVTLKNFVLFTMQQYVFGADEKSLTKRFFIEALPTMLKSVRIDKFGTTTNCASNAETAELFGTYFSKSILWFVGTSGVGKSKLISALTRPISNPNIDLTYETQGDPIDANDEFAYCEKMVVRMAEVRDLSNGTTCKLKKLSGDAKVTYRKLYQSPTTANIRATTIIDSNSPELNKDATGGLNNRILPLMCPDVPLLFCSFKDNNSERKNYLNNNTYTTLETNRIFSDLWGYAWNELKQGRYYPELDSEVKEIIFNQNTSDMYIPDQVTFLEERLVTDISKEDAEEINKHCVGNKKYLVFDMTITAFMLKITELAGLGTKLKKEDAAGIQQFITKNYLIKSNVNASGKTLGKKVQVVLNAEGVVFGQRQVFDIPL